MKTNTQYGDVTKQLFEFVKRNGPTTYTELNKFYQMEIKGKSSYDPVQDRGGSFSHHLRSMVQRSKRHYSGNVEFLAKASHPGGRGKYHLMYLVN